MRRDAVHSLVDALRDPDIEEVRYVAEPSYGIVVGSFARGQTAFNGSVVWAAFGARIGTFATGQRDPNKKIKVLR